MNEIITLHGLVRKFYDLKTALTKQSDTSQSGSFVICPRVIRLESYLSKLSRIPLRVCNLSEHSQLRFSRNMLYALLVL